ncbi:hypothetical protein AVEN_261275-1 [Araneus ventricosus]|uniref:Uncharacterized protein n=1 Tax=Araneus ventricosus TaxID=182803 RepID=A0A4Y2GLC7_ARAVE|nr:hypothetical protein AVEN_261275-1 [Araneus ventricosus]
MNVGPLENRVSKLELSGLEAETLPLSHHGPSGAKESLYLSSLYFLGCAMTGGSRFEIRVHGRFVVYTELGTSNPSRVKRPPEGVELKFGEGES